MNRQYQVKSDQTIEMINRLIDSGIHKISAIIRHSDRFFSKDARQEPFMGLTEKGKTFALEFGTAMRPNPTPRLCASPFGRCIETAYLIDKGFTRKHGALPAHPCLNPFLAPFYIKDIEAALHQLQDQGSESFLRNWFDGRINETIMENPEKTASLLSDTMIEQIQGLDEGQVSICVSHDWNIYPLREFKLGIAHEHFGNVNYLDGVFFYEQNGRYYITSHDAGPVLIS